MSEKLNIDEITIAFLGKRFNEYSKVTGLSSALTPKELTLARLMGEYVKELGYPTKTTNIYVILRKRLEELGINRGLKDASFNHNFQSIIKKIDGKYITNLIGQSNAHTFPTKVGLWYNDVVEKLGLDSSELEIDVNPDVEEDEYQQEI